MTFSDRRPTAEDASVDAFRGALRHLVGAVSVITTGSGTGRAGLTATSVTSLSAEPPTILVNVNRGASAFARLLSERRFAVAVLASTQQAVADRFAGKGGLQGAARFDGAEWTTLATGAPILVGALAVLDCELEEVIERHSHGILIGRVKATASTPDADALLYWRGAYARFAGTSLVATAD